MIRRRPERGAAAVEAALVTPIFVLLLVSILEFGLYFKDALTVSNASAAGVRVAAAKARVGTYAQDAVAKVAVESGALGRNGTTQVWVYEANATNNFPLGFSSFANCSTCAKFTWNGSAFVLSTNTWNATTHDACSASPPDRIGVYIRTDHPAVTGLIFNTLTIERASVSRFEPVPSRLGCK